MATPKLTRVQRLDSISLDQTYFTDEGYLVDHPIVTSTGIFEYTNPDGSTRRELRLPEDVFAGESLKTYRGKPIIITHDAGYVDKDNVEEEQIGTILSEGYQDGDDVRAEIIIHDTDAMKECGLRELSLGYNLRLEEKSGVWNGQPYDAIQRDIVINHLALVGNARAGDQARLNIDARDHKNTLKGGKIMATTKRKDGDMMSPEDLTAAVEAFQQRRAERMGAVDNEVAEEKPIGDEDTVAEKAADEAIEETAAPAAEGDKDAVQMVKDRRDRRDAEGDPEEMGKAMGVIAQQDEDIDTLLGVIDVLQAANAVENVTDSDEENTDEDEENTDEEGTEGTEEKANADRKDSKDDFREMLRVVRIGDKLRMDGLEMMSVKSAKKAILKKLKPSLRLDGKSMAYVNAAFDMAVNDMNNVRKDTNYQRKQMTMNKDSKSSKSVGSAAEARQRMIDKRMKKEEK